MLLQCASDHPAYRGNGRISTAAEKRGSVEGKPLQFAGERYWRVFLFLLAESGECCCWLQECKSWGSGGYG
jgi:hypothetical protein